MNVSRRKRLNDRRLHLCMGKRHANFQSMKAPLILAIAALLCTGAAGSAEDVTPESLVGKPLPSLASLNYFKTRADLKGKPAIVEFWATWCPPCRKSIPHLNEIYKEYAPKGLQVVGITDEPDQTIRAFIKTNPIDYPVAIARQEVLETFGISGIPQAFLVNKEGNIVWQGHPMSLSKEEIKKIL
jgi:thiol-disulfide isomerase/thioredoxin